VKFTIVTAKRISPGWLIIKHFAGKKIGLVVLSNSQALEAITAFKPGPFQERHSDEKTICDFFILAYFLGYLLAT